MGRRRIGAGGPALPARALSRTGATWRPEGQAGLSAHYRDWLTHADSLTARLRTYRGVFAVQILFQGVGRPLSWERALLRAGTVCHVREVLLLVDGRAVVWARTVLDQSALRGPWRFLSGLGTRPLGARLFTDPAISRSRFLFLPPGCLAFSGAGRQTPTHGARALRCALLARAGKVALLSEVLLPAVLALQHPPGDG